MFLRSCVLTAVFSTPGPAARVGDMTLGSAELAGLSRVLVAVLSDDSSLLRMSCTWQSKLKQTNGYFHNKKCSCNVCGSEQENGGNQHYCIYNALNCTARRCAALLTLMFTAGMGSTLREGEAADASALTAGDLDAEAAAPVGETAATDSDFFTGVVVFDLWLASGAAAGAGEAACSLDSSTLAGLLADSCWAWPPEVVPEAVGTGD